MAPHNEYAHETVSMDLLSYPGTPAPVINIDSIHIGHEVFLIGTTLVSKA